MKSNRKRVLSLCMTMFLVSSLLLCGFQFAPSSGEWMTSPTGSAKYLDGTTVLVSLFVEDPTSSWSDDERQIVMSKLDLAADFLVTEGLSYGKNVNLVYDINSNPNLEYTVSYPKEIIDSDDTSFELLTFMTKYINSQIPTEELLEEYGTDSIAYMCFLDKDGVSFAYPYYEEDADIYYYETCYLYLHCDGDYEPPAVYAHELLHLFGARDLYASNEYDGITKDFVQHIETNYSNEIMLTTYDENWNNVQSHVSNDLTDITAYFIGWKSSIPELSAYPSIATYHRACFSEHNDTNGDYSDYTAGDYDYGYDPGSNRWGSDQFVDPTLNGWGTKEDCVTDDCNTTYCSGWGSDSGWACTDTICGDDYDYGCYDDYDYGCYDDYDCGSYDDYDYGCYDDDCGSYDDYDFSNIDFDNLTVWDIIWLVLYYLFG